MTSITNDPFGQAVLDYSQFKKNKQIIVKSDICDDDIIETSYLFRSFEEMPIIEQKALELCEGKILDIGIGAGIHSLYLKNKGEEVYGIDISEGCIEHAKNIGLNCELEDIWVFKDQKFDTLLLLMNGIGLAGAYVLLEDFLYHLGTLLNENGKIIVDSTDISYIYPDDNLGMNELQRYYGDFEFQMEFEDHRSEPFDWVYVDKNSLIDIASKNGLRTKILLEDDNQYLAELTLMKND